MPQNILIFKIIHIDWKTITTNFSVEDFLITVVHMTTHSSSQKSTQQSCDPLVTSSFYGSCRLWYLLHFSPNSLHTWFAVTFLQHFNCSLKPSSTEISLKTTNSLQLRVSGNGKGKKAIQIHTLLWRIHTLTEATCVITLPHCYCIAKLFPLPRSRISTLAWKLLNSASKNKLQSYVLSSNDDFSCVQHYFVFSLYFTLNQGFKKNPIQC